MKYFPNAASSNGSMGTIKGNAQLIRKNEIFCITSALQLLLSKLHNVLYVCLLACVSVVICMLSCVFFFAGINYMYRKKTYIRFCSLQV